MKKTSIHLVWKILLLASPLLALSLSFAVGSLHLSLFQLFDLFTTVDNQSLAHTIVWQIRLPRALLAALVGASLSLSGVTFQAVLRNPLADPYLLGVSGGAALGAVIGISFGFSSQLAIALLAFCGALSALLLVYLVAQAHSCSSHTLILSGVVVGSLAAAILLFLLWRAPVDATRQAIFWLAGNLALADPEWLGWGGLWFCCGFALIWLLAPRLDLLTQGEESAADLGLNVAHSRLTFFILAGALTAGAVAMAGLVGFVGLVVPHICRIIWGPAHRLLIPVSAIFGATFLMLADTISRTIYAPAEIPVGVITAMLGAPFFLLLMRRKGGL
jgi:iron complex transport system permease protein